MLATFFFGNENILAMERLDFYNRNLLSLESLIGTNRLLTAKVFHTSAEPEID